MYSLPLYMNIPYSSGNISPSIHIQTRSVIQTSILIQACILIQARILI
jgi:hypothetical protein